MLININESEKTFIFGGDLNINLLSNKSTITDYKDTLLSLGCNQTVNVPTRFSCNFENCSLLDHVYTNATSYNVSTKILTYDLSDHLPSITLFEKIPKNRIKNQTQVKQDLKNFDPENFLIELESNLEQFKSNQYDENVDPNEVWDKFENTFSKTVYSHAPLRKLSRKEKRIQSKPWLTKAIRKSIKTKNKMFSKAIKNKTEKFSNTFKIYRNILKRTIRLSKKLYFQESVKKATGNSKNLWKVINNIITTKSPKCQYLNSIHDCDGLLIEDPLAIGDIMNKNFVDIADKLLKTNDIYQIPH